MQGLRGGSNQGHLNPKPSTLPNEPLCSSIIVFYLAPCMTKSSGNYIFQTDICLTEIR